MPDPLLLLVPPLQDLGILTLPPNRNRACRNRSRFAHPYFPENRNPTTSHSRRRRHNADRFIPNRSARDEEEEEEEESLYAAAPDSYRKLLAKALGIGRSRILSFRNKPSEPRELLLEMQPRLKPQRYIPKNPEEAVNAPHLIDGLYLNFAGLDSSDVQFWDSSCNRLLRTLRGVHGNSGVGSLCWNNSNILTTGGKDDGKIINLDMRMESHVIQTYRRYVGGEVCRLKWSSSGQQLASRGSDRRLQQVYDQVTPDQETKKFSGWNINVSSQGCEINKSGS